jgi:flavin-dependent dehydrogenase
VGRIRGADVTWRHVPASAGPGYFLTGDAAVVLDPAASHGVLRALMSGMMAGHTVRRIVSGLVPEPAAVESYRRWTSAWFHHDVRRLSALYDELDPAWAGRRARTQ